MRDALWPGTALGYCTNVHAGTTLEEVKANLERHALAVKAQVSPSEPMGIGLWLAADVARELIERQRVEELRDWLGERGLDVFTMNGFPYGNFHEPVVKHKVYEPDWTTSARLLYTLDLAQTLGELLPSGAEGSISTLPVGWPAGGDERGRLGRAAENLRDAARGLEVIQQRTGRLIHLDLEPEPGCTLSRCDDVIRFMERLLHDAPDGDALRAHLGVCHDVCHAEVMFESQATMFDRYEQAGITVGKVQVSNAPRLDLRKLSARERTDAIAQLRPFAEDRYLHQTNIRDGDEHQFFADLPRALDEYGQSDRAGDEWRIHYHVPIYLESFGLIGTTQNSIIECLRLLRDRNVAHWEIETYAWNVLPRKLQHETLADGIAQEFRWLIEQAERLR